MQLISAIALEPTSFVHPLGPVPPVRADSKRNTNKKNQMQAWQASPWGWALVNVTLQLHILFLIQSNKRYTGQLLGVIARLVTATYS